MKLSVLSRLVPSIVIQLPGQPQHRHQSPGLTKTLFINRRLDPLGLRVSISYFVRFPRQWLLAELEDWMNDEQEDGRSRTSALVLYIVRRAKKPLRPLNNAIGLVGVQGGDVK